MNSENEFLKFATRKWYVIDSESNGSYSQDDPINFLTKLIELGLCDYSDAYILATGNIAVKRRNAADPADIALCPITQVAFKNCVPFKTSKQKSMMLLFMKQKNFTLQCLCTIWLNTVTIILINQKVYGVLKDMKQKITQM